MQPNHLHTAARGAFSRVMTIRAQRLMQAWLAPIALLLLAAACSDSSGPVDRRVTVGTSFEQGLGAWSVAATDVMVGEEELAWSVTTSTERASDGATSVRFTADNRSDAAKLWIERHLDLRPNTTYQVTIFLHFATSDQGVVNLWRILAGALPSSPTTTEDLEPTFQDETGKPTAGDGYVWIPKTYQESVTTGADGNAVIVIGVWGTFEAVRTYYIDDVEVVAVPTD